MILVTLVGALKLQIILEHALSKQVPASMYLPSLSKLITDMIKEESSAVQDVTDEPKTKHNTNDTQISGFIILEFWYRRD